MSEQLPPSPSPQPQPAFPYQPVRRRSYGPIWTGLLLVLVGAYFLLQNLGLLEGVRWAIVWPVILILIGLYFVGRRLIRR